MGKTLKAVLLALGLASALMWVAKLSGQTPGGVGAKEMISLIVALLPLLESRRAKPFSLPPSFTRGVYGGLIGGFVAGLIIAVRHYFVSQGTQYPAPWSAIPETVVYASLFVGGMIGGVTLYVIYWFRYLTDENDYPAIAFNELTGGAIAGVIVGVIAGAIGGYWFVDRPVSAVGSDLLVWGAAVGPIFVVFGALRYDFHGNLRNLWRAVIMSALAAICLGVFGVFLANKYDIQGLLQTGEDTEGAITAGVYVGIPVGLMLGLEIGLALLLYRLMEVRRETNDRAQSA